MTSALSELAGLPLVERLGWTLIHFVWQASIVSAIVAAALHVFRNVTAKARYAGLCVGLLVVAVAPVFTFVWLSLDARPEIHGVVAIANERSAEIDRDIRRDAAGQLLSIPAIGDHPAGRAAAVGPSVETQEPQAAAVSAIRLSVRSSAPWIVAAWMFGVGLFSVWHMAGWLIARRLTTWGTRPVSDDTQAMLDRLVQRMGIRAAVRLLESTVTSVPIVVGWLKPVLLMPASVLCGLPPDELQAILAHELAHVRRHDFLVNVLQTVVETCLFYHPAVWWLSRRIRIEREYCADEEAAAVCADRDVYAQALVSLAGSVLAVPRPPVPSPAVAATGGSLTRRIRRVLGLSSGRERSTGQPSWLISAVLGLAVFWGLFASTLSSAQPKDQPAVEMTPIKKIAERLTSTLKGWTLHERDEQPGVAVAGHRGFRLVLRRTWKEYVGTNQQQAASPESVLEPVPYELRHEDWEFVLIPVAPQAAPAEIKTKIEWRKSNSPYYTRDVCLGQGLGYVWFTRGTLFGQEWVRDSLKLEGGDDRLQLAMDGLQVDDPGTTTANSCLHIPAKFGDKALPYIEKTIEQSQEGDDLWRVVGSLANIQTDRSTELLLKLFDSKNDDMQRAAQYALIHQPYRKDAKRAYLDMLKRQSSLESAVAASVEFQWTEAVPLLRDVMARPQHLAHVRQAIPARRTLEGRPIEKELLDAEQTLHALMRSGRDPELNGKIDAAKRFLIQSADSEAANLAALSLATFVTKGNAKPVNEAGLAILKSRPRQSTLAFLKSLAAVRHDTDQRQVENLLNAVGDAPATP